MRKIMYVEALNEALREEMDRDPRVIIIGENVGNFDGVYKVTKGLLQDYGKERVIDTPISENGLMGVGVGTALTGFRPVVEQMYANFFTQAFDQLVNQVAKHRFITGGKFVMPMVIRTQGGTGKRYGGQHTDFFENFFVNVPGLKVIMPSSPADAKGLLKSAIRDDNPIVFIEHKSLYFAKGEVPDGDYTIPIGKADVKRNGTDITIIATSMMVNRSLQAADLLEKEGISAEVVDPRTLKPLDMDTIIESVQKTNRVLIVHETYKTGGFGGEISARIMEEAFDFLDAPVKRLCGMEVPTPVAKLLEDAVIPRPGDIVEAAKEVLK